MASSLIPPIDFSRSGSSFATAVTTSDTPPCDCNDDDDSEYATTLASTAPEELARAPSSTPSIQQDQLFASANSTEWADDVPFEAAKNRFLSRLFSRHGTCDIHAISSDDFGTTFAACRQLVLQVGGRILDDFAYPGGFLYQLPPGTASPLTNGKQTACGGSISIALWTPFPRALFNGLKLAPYGSAGELLVIPVPPHRSSAVTEKAWPRSSPDDMTKKRVSSWIGSLASNYGSSMSYMT
ncbi:hypothetical protein B0A50_05300 [Salinomyces thailandicus]|uniref:Uncharacterized protein n=1 Tax=Salinomyces thailandicus TaxID=706561 RepID=A0A4U0TVR5_9PEZI|nr:hypothetical protein B0A50_05300 [Salinomyces thailandica]